MSTDYRDESFKIWASDNMIYGPVSLATLIQWVEETRVLAGTWVHTESDNAWRHAQDIEPLRSFLLAGSPHANVVSPSAAGLVAPKELRQFAVFAGLADAELEQFIRFGGLCEARPDELIIRKGDPGDALYFVLTGGVRARLLVGLQDTTLGHIRSGEFFGEMATFTQTARSADVVAEGETRLLRVSSQALKLLLQERPALAATVLHGIVRVMANRILADNRRLQRDVASEFLWR